MIEKHSTAWHEALDAHVRERASQPFAWGTNDCCTFACDWVQIARGTDPMEDLRGVDSALAAARVLEGEGGLLAAVTKRMGEPLPGGMAQVGDMVLVRHGDRQSLGICLGHLVAVPGEDALQFPLITAAEAAWRV